MWVLRHPHCPDHAQLMLTCLRLASVMSTDTQADCLPDKHAENANLTVCCARSGSVVRRQ